MTRSCPKCGTLFVREQFVGPVIPKQPTVAGLAAALREGTWQVECGNGHRFDVKGATWILNAPNEYDLA